MADIDITLLALGLVRCVIWSLMIAHGIYYKRKMQTFVGVLTTTNSVIFALINAHVDLPQWAINTSVGSAVPIVTGIVGVIILNARFPKDKSRWDW